jgi:transposase
VATTTQLTELPDTVPACHALIHQLMQRLAMQEEQGNLNSRNSSKPPSSDGPGVPERPSKPPSDKKLGAQPGHKGSFRAMVPEQDVHYRIECLPSAQCDACGSAVHVDGEKAMRHQVFDLPKIEPIVSEYVRLRGICSGCGRKHHGALPAGVPNGQLGPRALALVGTLAGQFHLTQRKVQAVLSQIMGMHFSLGAVSQAHGLVSQALDKPVAQLHAELRHAPVCHADETRHQSHRHTMWMWVLASDWGVRFRIDPSRGQAAAILILGEQPSFITVSDRYAGYNHLPLEKRQVCWAHLLRDFERIAQRGALPGRIGQRLLGYGCLLFRWREQDKDARHFVWLQRRMLVQLEQGSVQTQCSRTAKTCANLLKMWPALWTFLRNPLVAPTNNAAERVLRDYVIKRKLSYCTRSKRGMDFTERIFSTVQTCKMQARVAYDFIHEAVHSWIGHLRPPSLVPEHIHLQHPA